QRSVISTLSAPVMRLPVGLVVVVCGLASGSLQAQRAAPSSSPIHSFVDQYCAGCHNSDKKKGDLDLESVSAENITGHPETWEKVVRRLRARQMPPADKKRPAESDYAAVLSNLEGTLDIAYARHPNPGRTDTFRRLN